MFVKGAPAAGCSIRSASAAGAHGAAWIARSRCLGSGLKSLGLCPFDIAAA